MKKTFAVIIPVFNSEDTLKKTLDSVVKQTHPYDEIICVDNGSTDNSTLILEAYSKKYENIFYVQESKTGVSAARNRGMKLVKSDYIFFLDADDIQKDTLVSVIDECLAKEEYPDLIQFNFIQEYSNGTSEENKYIVDSGHYMGREFFKKNIDMFLYETKNMVWSMVFSNTFLKNLQLTFNENLTMYEDIAFLQKIYMCNPTIFVTHFIGVVYQYSSGSSTQSITEKKLVIAIEELITILSPLDDFQKQYLVLLSAKVLNFRYFNKVPIEKKETRTFLWVKYDQIIRKIKKKLKIRNEKNDESTK